ncbi:hypothetical protein [Sagittula salina]|uniref:Uncharacterized protein n=1 Tax=Sagittula salina TaxID=2820268 RepID=A0A940MRL4_9RHOB|nr:hypothetical protein [Sagittula salina]MBP0481754.1 hypothetical protein [Sagittula salina]
MRDPAPEAAAHRAVLERGRHLARQDAWDTLAAEMRAAEAEGQLTPGLTPLAHLLALGARADVVEAARTAIARGETARVCASLNAFEACLGDEPDTDQPQLTYVVAMAHVETARAWRGGSKAARLAEPRRAAWAHHMGCAAHMADRFDPFEQHSVLWAALRCAVLEADPAPATRFADDYEDLIELDPRLPASMKALGREALPDRRGSWSILDREARRVAAQTREAWGMAGYAWVAMGAAECDLAAFHRLDGNLFCEGLHEILERCPTQDMANRLAAFTGLTVGQFPGAPPAHRWVADCFGWITQDHLRELHPLIWAEARTPGRRLGSEGDDLEKRGRIRAWSSLADYYAPALEAGRRLVFAPDGVRMVKE